MLRENSYKQGQRTIASWNHLIRTLVSAGLSIFIVLAQAVRATPEASDAKSANSDRSFVAAPLIMSSPAFGNGVGAMGLYFYRPDRHDKTSPPSTVTLVGAYSDTDSYFVGAFNQNHLRGDTWRPKFGLANGRINHEFDIPQITDKVEFTSDVNAAFGRFDWRYRGNVFLGVKAGYVDTRYTPNNDAARVYFQISEIENNASGQIGVLVNYDSREHVRYPNHGVLAELSYTSVPDWLGSKESYHAVEGYVNHYDTLQPGHILALRTYGRFTPSGTPYAGLSTLGQRSDLRGYTAGEKTAENIVSGQAEYRWMFKPKWGAVGFAGVAALYDGSVENIDSDTIFYSGGVGLRYLLQAENRVNFRIDYAWGEDDDKGYYISMSEAFL